MCLNYRPYANASRQTDPARAYRTDGWTTTSAGGAIGSALRPGQDSKRADIAEAILFLAAGGAMITGHTLPVDGGLV